MVGPDYRIPMEDIDTGDLSRLFTKRLRALERPS